MSSKQIKVGNECENLVINNLRKKGYWAYLCPKNNNGGQPIDIIAAKNDKIYKIWFMDAKHVREQTSSFAFARIEPNQISSFMYLTDFANIEQKYMGFAIYFEKMQKLLWLPFEDYVKMFNEGKKSVNYNDLSLFDEVIQ